MTPHVDPRTLPYGFLSQEKHLSPEHCEAAGCNFEEQHPSVRAAAESEFQKHVDFHGDEKNIGMMQRAADIRARKRNGSRPEELPVDEVPAHDDVFNEENEHTLKSILENPPERR